MEKWEYIGSSPGTDGTVVSFRKTHQTRKPRLVSLGYDRSVHGLPVGIYHLRLTASGKTPTHKIVKTEEN